MVLCKQPKTNEDLKEKIPYNWDAMLYDKEIDVYCLPGFYHSIGGRKGLNDLYCCYRGEKLSIDNIMAFSGESCKWDMKLISNNSSKCKYGTTSVEHNYKLTILRNNKHFYTIYGYNIDYLLAKYKLLMIEIEEHPIPFHMKDYEGKIVNREILWNKCPSRIHSYWREGRIAIIPDGTTEENKKFKKYSQDFEDGYKVLYKNKLYGLNYKHYKLEIDRYVIVEDIFASSINWFR